MKRRAAEEEQQSFATNVAHIADMVAIHNALASLGGALSKVEHVLGSDDARAKQAALKDLGARIEGALEAIGVVEEHISAAEMMADMSEGEQRALRERLGASDDDEDDG